MIFKDRPPAPLADHIGFLMNWIGQRSRRGFVDGLRPLGIDPRLYGILVIADANPGATQQELAALAEVDPSSLVALIDELEAAGLAERRPHPADRRKRAIHLTAQGTRKLAAARKVATTVGAELTARLTASERADLARLLRKLTGADGDSRADVG